MIFQDQAADCRFYCLPFYIPLMLHPPTKTEELISGKGEFNLLVFGLHGDFAASNL
jgi:hypothetical protein